MTAPAPGAVVAVGERIERTLHFSAEDIARFARLTLDENPLHHDHAAAGGSRFGAIIAAGQHTSAIMMGLVATHYSRRDDGVAREMLCLNFNFSYKLPVFAEQDLLVEWKVTSVEWKGTLGGWLAQLDGRAAMRDSAPSVIARGTILVKDTAAPSSG